MVKSNTQKKKIAVKKKTSSGKRTNAKSSPVRVSHASTRKKRYAIHPEHIEFICWEIAEWRTKRIAAVCIDKFSDYPPSESDPKQKKWWSDRISKNFPLDRFGNPTDKCTYRDRIFEYRKEVSSKIKESIPLANSCNRAKLLQDTIEYCNTEHERTIKRVKKNKNGEERIAYRTEYGKDVNGLLKALDQLRAEVGDDKIESGNNQDDWTSGEIVTVNNGAISGKDFIIHEKPKQNGSS